MPIPPENIRNAGRSPPGTRRVPTSFSRVVHASDTHRSTSPTNQPTTKTKPADEEQDQRHDLRDASPSRAHLEPLARFVGDIRRIADLVEQGPDLRLPFVGKCSTRLGDVVGDLAYQLPPAPPRQIGELALEPLQVRVDETIGRGLHRRPFPSAKLSTALRKRRHSGLNWSSADRPALVRPQ
jgi:hypothetical protein